VCPFIYTAVFIKAPKPLDSAKKMSYNVILHQQKEHKMARITSELAAQQIGNIYELVLVATRRVRELRNGHAPMVEKINGDVVTALREVEEGKIGREYLVKPLEVTPERKRRERPC
jgi:DNA-directed RNA polymerase subunit omega